MTSASRVVAGSLASALIGAGIAHAIATAGIGPVGLIAEGGAVANLEVRVSCEPVGDVGFPLEAMLFLTQENQTIAGEGGIGGIICDGTPRWLPVRVTAFEGSFHAGRARASAFVLICDPNGIVCEQAQAVREIHLRGD
jgi:hypothetical protein